MRSSRPNHALPALTGCCRRKQYITRLKQWGYEKNIKDEGMRAIVRKDLKRKAKDPLRPSSFRLRGRPVPKQKIERYEKDKGFAAGDLLTDEATPSAISCETPRSVSKSPPLQEGTASRGFQYYNSLTEKQGQSISIYLSLFRTISALKCLVDPQWAWMDLIHTNLMGPSLPAHPNSIDLAVHPILVNTAGGKLEITFSIDNTASQYLDSPRRSLGVLWQLMHAFVVPGARNPTHFKCSPQLRLKWRYQNQSLTRGTIRLESTANPDKNAGRALFRDHWSIDMNDPAANLENTYEPKEYEVCSCSLCNLACNLAFTSCVHGGPHTASIRYYHRRPAILSCSYFHSSYGIFRCPMCCLARSSGGLYDLDLHSLKSVSNGASVSCSVLHSLGSYRLSWSVPCTDKVQP